MKKINLYALEENNSHGAQFKSALGNSDTPIS